MKSIIEKKGRFEFDHVVLGVRDTKMGVEYFSSETGLEAVITDPEDGQWYWSAVLSLPDGAMLEVLGPNPAYRQFHVFKEILKKYETPAPIFWYIGTRDFDQLCLVAKAAGSPVERIERLDYEGPQGRCAYTRGVVGPGFRTTRPCVVQWTERPNLPEIHAQPPCRVVDFLTYLAKSVRFEQNARSLRIGPTRNRRAGVSFDPPIHAEGRDQLLRTRSGAGRLQGPVPIRETALAVRVQQLEYGSMPLNKVHPLDMRTAMGRTWLIREALQARP